MGDEEKKAVPSHDGQGPSAEAGYDDKNLQTILGLLKHLSDSSQSKLVAALGLALTQDKPTPSTSGDDATSPGASSSKGASKVKLSKSSHFINSEIPRLPTFSGSHSTKGETSYNQWRYDVLCLVEDNVWPGEVILQSVRRSVRGIAAEVLVNLGRNTDVDQVIKKFDSVFGNILTPEQILEDFYVARQLETESVTEWGC